MTSARRDLDDSEVDWSQCTWLSYDTALSQYSLYLFRKCVIPHTSGAHCLQDQWPSFQTHPCLGTLRMCRWWPPHVMRYISPDKMRQHYQEIKLSFNTSWDAHAKALPADHMSSLLYEHEMSRDSSLPVISTCWRTGTSRKSPRPNSVLVAFVVTPASPRFLLRARADRCFTGTFSLVRKTDIFFLNAALNWKNLFCWLVN